MQRLNERQHLAPTVKQKQRVALAVSARLAELARQAEQAKGLRARRSQKRLARRWLAETLDRVLVDRRRRDLRWAAVHDRADRRALAQATAAVHVLVKVEATAADSAVAGAVENRRHLSTIHLRHCKRRTKTKSASASRLTCAAKSVDRRSL